MNSFIYMINFYASAISRMVLEAFCFGAVHRCIRESSTVLKVC